MCVTYFSSKQNRFPCGDERKPMEQEWSFPKTDGTEFLKERCKCSFEERRKKSLHILSTMRNKK